jgi:hypothetical protein
MARIILKESQLRRLMEQTSPLVQPGNTSDDYFKNKQGDINVGELPDVTVTAPRKPKPSPNPAPAPQPAQQQQQTMSGEQMHNMLMQKGLINGFKDIDGYDNRRIVYKGAPLSQEQLNIVTNYFVSKGYGKRFSQVADKRYGQKYVWVKGGTPSSDDMAAV